MAEFKLRPGVPEVSPKEDWGFKKTFSIDRNAKKKVLITGQGSYIGESFKKWSQEHYADNFQIDDMSVIGDDWKQADFSLYDAVFHVAGLAHADVGNVSDEVKEKYYQVNTDLAIAVAKKAKEDGVNQFVFMSSMIIYGESAGYGKKKVVTETTKPSPANFYGDSKWQADRGVRALASEDFNVAVLRPPMIYGKGSKGNYPVLAKLAKKLPIFPNVNNERSMLHIDNLCEFLSLLMLSGQSGIYIPQNAEYTKTSEMVQMIGQVTGSKVRLTKALNPCVSLASIFPGKIGGLANKAFGNMAYDESLSKYEGMNYIINSLEESVIRTEG